MISSFQVNDACYVHAPPPPATSTIPQRPLGPTYRQKSEITNHFHGNVRVLQLGHQQAGPGQRDG